MARVIGRGVLATPAKPNEISDLYATTVRYTSCSRPQVLEGRPDDTAVRRTDNDAVAVWALLGVVIHGFQDDSLLACVAALEQHDDLSVLKTAQQPRFQVQAEGSYLRLSPARFY